MAYGPFSLVIPAGWSQRAVPEDWSPTSRYGAESPVAQVSSTPLAGFDEGRMRPGQIVVFAYQLGRFGSKGLRTPRRSDFIPTTGPGGIRATQAGGFSCLGGGRCFSLAVLIASPAPSRGGRGRGQPRALLPARDARLRRETEIATSAGSAAGPVRRLGHAGT